MNGLIFYRCRLCGHIVSEWDVKEGGCSHCGGTRISYTNPTFWEKITQILKHPKIWEWSKLAESQTDPAVHHEQ